MLSWLSLANEGIGFAMKREPGVSRENLFAPEYWDMEFMKSLEELLYNEYWTRVWILQEFVLASTITLHCSNHQVDSRRYYGLTNLLATFEWAMKLPSASGLHLLTQSSGSAGVPNMLLCSCHARL